MPSHHFLRVRSRGAIGCSRRFNHNATRMCALSVALLFLAFGEMPLPAQDKPMKWGEVPRADLEMKSFPADSNASAVILCDFGEVSFDTEYELNFWRHRRIKILSPAGFKWGEVFLTYRAKDRSQRINDLEGFTFILAADGNVRREKLDKKSIFEEKVDDEHRRIRFALPALVPGAVVEYRYRVHSKYAVYLPNWSFQDSEPTRWSELRVEIPSVFNYVLVHQEISKFDVHESGERPFTTSGSTRLKAMYHRWVMKDLPALREEPFMTTVEDYCAQMRFQLASIRPPGTGMEEKVMHTWEELAAELLDADNFGRQIDRHGVLREQASALTAGMSDPEAQMRRIYDYVRTTMSWDGTRGFVTDVSLDQAWRARRGGGPEIALMLTGMLRAAGLEAHPVLISTRDNGRVIDVYSLLSQFDHVLTHVRIGTKEYLLDATDPLRPFDLLPVAALNQVGWLVKAKHPQWVSIVNPGTYFRETLVDAALAADGTLTGSFSASGRGYSALFDRHSLRDGKKEEDFLQDGWLNGLAGAQLDSFAISNRDSSEAPLLAQAQFTSAEHTHVAGDNLYFNPMFFGRTEANPLRNPQRTFPVDFAYGRVQLYTINLRLPSDCAVQDLPGNISVDLAGGGAKFLRAMEVNGSHLQMISQIVIRKVRFHPQEYKALRDFYDRIVAAHAQQVVLKRVTATSKTEGRK